jgi:hypothetical protein
MAIQPKETSNHRKANFTVQRQDMPGSTTRCPNDSVGFQEEPYSRAQGRCEVEAWALTSHSSFLSHLGSFQSSLPLLAREPLPQNNFSPRELPQLSSRQVPTLFLLCCRNFLSKSSPSLLSISEALTRFRHGGNVSNLYDRLGLPAYATSNRDPSHDLRILHLRSPCCHGTPLAHL